MDAATPMAIPSPGQRWDNALWREVWRSQLTRDERSRVRSALRWGQLLDDGFEIRVVAELARRRRRTLALASFVLAMAAAATVIIAQTLTADPGDIVTTLLAGMTAIGGSWWCLGSRRALLPHTVEWVDSDLLGAIDPFLFDGAMFDELDGIADLESDEF